MSCKSRGDTARLNLRPFHAAAVDRERPGKRIRIVLNAVIPIGLSCIPNTVPRVPIDAPPRDVRLLYRAGTQPFVFLIGNCVRVL